MSNDPNPDGRPDQQPSEPYDPDSYAFDPYLPDDSAPAPGPYPDEYQPPIPTQLPPGPALPPPYAYQPPPPPNTSAIVLTVISGFLLFTVYLACIGIAPLVLGILGITKNATDPEGAAKLTKIGWIVLVVLSALVALIVAGLIAIAVVGTAGVG